MSNMQVKTGGWINWSHGQILGATLTLSTRDGTLLTTFLALVVTYAGSQLWIAFSFALHQYRSTRTPQDGLYHQQQVLLRSGLSDFSFLWRLLKIIWAWRQIIPKAISKSLLLTVFTLLHLIIFIAASLLTSKLGITDGDVLVVPSGCGWLSLLTVLLIPFGSTNTNFADPLSKIVLYVAGNYIFRYARFYTDSCYRELSGSDPSLCNRFVKRSLPYKMNLNDSCPFADGVCAAPAITLDTGLLDSHLDFGINTATSDRLKFRKKFTCAPIDIDDRFSSPSSLNTTQKFWPWEPDNNLGVSYTEYSLGKHDMLGKVTPYTFYISNYSGSYEHGYKPFVIPSFPNDPTFNEFDPNPEFVVPNADLTLLGMINRVLYMDPVKNDPFFKATTRGNGSGFSPLFYQADQSVAMLACTEQYQICNGNRCSSLDALNGFNHSTMSEIGCNSRQLAVFDIFYYIGFSARLHSMVHSLQEQIFLASELAASIYDISPGLPDNQWQLEVANIFNISLAVVQQMPIDHAAPANISLVGVQTIVDYIHPENETYHKSLCHNIKLRRPGFISFNILALSLILASTFSIIMLGNFAPNVARFWRRKHPSVNGQYRTEDWNAGDILQLHRVALESYGISGWRVVHDVPITSDGAQNLEIPWLGEQHKDSLCSSDTQSHLEDFKQYRISLKLNTPEIVMEFV